MPEPTAYCFECIACGVEETHDHDTPAGWLTVELPHAYLDLIKRRQFSTFGGDLCGECAAALWGEICRCRPEDDRNEWGDECAEWPSRWGGVR